MSGTFSLLLEATTGSVTLPQPIPAQKITLKLYRIQFDTVAHSRENVAVMFSADWTRTSSLFNGQTEGVTAWNLGGLAIPVHDEVVSYNECDISFDLAKDIPQRFRYELTGVGNNGGLTGFTNILLVFEYQYAAII
jgi:hypothetical protein